MYFANENTNSILKDIMWHSSLGFQCNFLCNFMQQWCSRLILLWFHIRFCCGPCSGSSTGSTAEVFLLDIIMKALAQHIKNPISGQIRVLL